MWRIAAQTLHSCRPISPFLSVRKGVGKGVRKPSFPNGPRPPVTFRLPELRKVIWHAHARRLDPNVAERTV